MVTGVQADTRCLHSYKLGRNLRYAQSIILLLIVVVITLIIFIVIDISVVLCHDHVSSCSGCVSQSGK